MVLVQTAKFVLGTDVPERRQEKTPKCRDLATDAIRTAGKSPDINTRAQRGVFAHIYMNV